MRVLIAGERDLPRPVQTQPALRRVVPHRGRTGARQNLSRETSARDAAYPQRAIYALLRSIVLTRGDQRSRHLRAAMRRNLRYREPHKLRRHRAPSVASAVANALEEPDPVARS